MKDKIRSLISDSESYVISSRRRVHAYAEVGGKEFKTSEFITQELSGFGFTVEKVSTTGVLGVLDTGKPGKALALRADIDALPVTEHPQNLKRERVCMSENPGCFHACGHDAHTAMLLGAARVLNAIKDSLSGKLLFCFEEGEEVGLGVKGMVGALLVHKPDAVWALHVSSTLKTGKINITEGPRLAGGRRIVMRVTGRGGHGSRPDLSINPVFAAAAITTNLSGVLQNQVNPDKPVTVGITSIQGGSSENVFPEYADIKGTMRFFDMEEGTRISEVVKDTARRTAEMLGCTVEFDPVTEWYGRSVINDRAITQRAEAALIKLGYAESLADYPPWYASESFSLYLAEFPGAFAFLGVENDEFGSGAAHHNEKFDIDETALISGVAANIAFAAADVI